MTRPNRGVALHSSFGARLGSAVAGAFLFGALGTASAGCGGGGSSTVTERLWVSGVPKSPREPLAAFATTHKKGETYLGAFFQGTLYRGGHDVFEWQPSGKSRARLQFLQDGRRVDVRTESCKPSRGFDLCVLVHGDPLGVVRYESRKRWVVKRPGKRKDAGALVLDTLYELSEDDDDLETWLEESLEHAGVED